MLQVKTLGRFTVLNGTESLSIPGVRDRALLAFLAITGHAHSREKLAGLLWSNKDEEQARQSLRQSLTTLRKLGVSVLNDGRERVGLSSGIACDVQSFVTKCQFGDLDALRSAIESYDGDLLADWTADLGDFNDWLTTERARLADIAVKTLRRLINWSAPKPDPADLLFLARRALAIDPYHEEAHRVELQALIRMGLRGEAVLVHQKFSELLQVELGIEPEQRTREIIELAKQPAISTHGEAVREPRETSKPSRPRLAVFPLRIESGLEDLDYLAKGIMAEIANVLSQFSTIQVIASQSSFQLEGETNRLDVAARSLRATYVLEGTLNRVPAGVQVRLELVDVADGSIVFADCKHGDAIDYPVFIQHLAHVIAGRIDSRISHRRRATLKEASPDRLAAWDLWARGQYISEKWSASFETEAEHLLRKAIAADPTLARAYSSLALLINGRILVRPGLPDDHLHRKEAMELARSAIELDPLDPRSHLAMAWVSTFLCDKHRSKRHAQLAFESNPHSADILIHVGLLKAYFGESDTGLQLANEAFELNPVFPDWYLYMKAQILILAGQPREALDVAAGVAGNFIELPGWLTVAAAESGDDAVMHEMATLFMSLVSQSWVGETPSSPELAVEWFLSVNRWLVGRERDLLVTGLKAAGLL